MVSTGIIRRIDDLGRVVIPKEIRRKLNLYEGDPMEIGVDKDLVILSKYIPSCSCVFCGEQESTKEFKGKYVCEACQQNVSTLL